MCLLVLLSLARWWRHKLNVGDNVHGCGILAAIEKHYISDKITRCVIMSLRGRGLVLEGRRRRWLIG